MKHNWKRLRALGPVAAMATVVALALPPRSRANIPPKSAASKPAAAPYVDRYVASGVDNPAGDDPVIRAAAVRALAGLNGTAVAVDPNNGRVLAMVNQPLALSADYQPCSTTKMAIALAALDRGVVNENTLVEVAPRWSVNLTQALAYSINAYFETLGMEMGFTTVAHYERELGLGERAGWDIPGEDPGVYPDAPGPGGVAKLSSFGEGIHISPLQLAAITTAIANGGTLYYLQHPTTPQAIADFTPRIKRELPIAALTTEIKDGMLGAVQYGTARLARIRDEQILGKTGTCSRDGTHFGLFASYLDVSNPRLVLVVILRNSHEVAGPEAAGVAGRIYRALDQEKYFDERPRTTTGAAESGTPSSAGVSRPLLQ